MAKKQTLKSLLGGSDSREQVSLDLGTPALQPTVQRAGQYSVAVQATPKTNSALQLAQALQTAPQIVGQYGNIQKGIGQDKAAAFDGDILAELKKNEPETFLTFQRQKAFRDVMKKRALNEVVLPQLKADADSFLDFDKFKDVGDAQEAMDGYLEERWGEFSSDIGESISKDEGTSALWNVVTNEWKAGITTNFINKQDAYTAEGLGDEMSLLLNEDFKKQYDENGDVMNVDVANIQSRMSSLEASLIDGGVNDAKTRKQTIQNVFMSKVENMVAMGQFNDAKSVLQNLQKAQVNGKPMFKGTDISKQVTSHYVSIQRGLKDLSANTSTEAVKLYSSNVTQSAQTLNISRKFEDLSDANVNTFHQTFKTLNPNITLEETAELISSELFNDQNGSPKTKYLQLLEKLAHEGDESANKIHTLGRSKVKLALTQQDVVVSSVRRTKEDETELTRKYEQHWYNTKAEERMTPDQFARSKGFTPYDGLRDAKTKITRGDYVQNVDAYTDVDSDLKGLFDNIEFKDVLMRQNFEDGAVTRIQTELEDYARSLVKPTGDNEEATEDETRALFEERRKKINDKAASLRTRELARYQSLVKAANTNITKVGMQPLSDAEIQEMENTDDDGYPTIGGFKFRNPLKAYEPTSEAINADRIEMVNNDHGPQLRKSLELFHFDSYSPKNAEYMSAAGLDAADVRLFADNTERMNTEDEWYAVLAKQYEKKPLTPDEKRSLKEALSYGVSNFTLLDEFSDAQYFLLNQR